MITVDLSLSDYACAIGMHCNRLLMFNAVVLLAFITVDDYITSGVGSRLTRLLWSHQIHCEYLNYMDR
jgi:hypothetical protein